MPPDNLQAKAMVDLVDQMNWTYVHAVAVTGSYGERGIDSFRKATDHVVQLLSVSDQNARD